MNKTEKQREIREYEEKQRAKKIILNILSR